MNIRLQFAIFILTFILIYAGLNSYAILRLGGILGIGRGILYALIVIVTAAIPATMYIERTFPNTISRILYTISTLWMGIMLFIICTLLVYEIVRPFYAVPYAGLVILSIVLALSVISIVNAAMVSVKEVQIPIEGLEKEVDIVQLTDMHVGTIRNSGFVKKVVSMTNTLDPDIVMITGDLVDASARLHEHMFSGFDTLRAPVYLVIGNHESYEGPQNVYPLFKETKIKVLRNETVTFDGIQVAGVEFTENKTALAKAIKSLKIDKNKPAVLMYHAPDGVEEAQNAGIDLQIAGHTHYGQIFPFTLFVRMRYKYLKGLYDVDGMQLYVNPGTGTWGPYMRLGSRNEITMIKLVPAQ